MSIKALQEYTRYSKYAKFNKEKQRRETWDEQVDRVFDMHEKKLGLEKLNLIEEDFKFTKDMMKKKRILGSQRALQFGGDPILKKNIRIYNCCASYCDRPRFFQESLFNLLAGTGVGFSVQFKDVEKLPNISKRSNEKTKYFIEDSIEGWSDSLGVLVSSYFISNQPFPEYFGKTIEFDFSKIRPSGSPLSWGGKAPGPNALKKSLEKIQNLFESILNDNRIKLKPIEAYDIIMHASDGVISGGVRRSATVCIFSPNDEEMCKAKTGDWFLKNPQRGRSNNSALLIREKTTKEDFNKLFKSTKEFGEPGFIWAENDRALYNPCFHPETRINTTNGLKKIKDLYNSQETVNVYIDTRPGKGDELNIQKLGIEVVPATKVVLTQKNADIYKLKTDHGIELKVTENHEFPTNKGRKKLKDLIVGDEIYLQSEEGGFGTFGTYNQGFLLGLITGDGCVCNDERAFIDLWEDDFENLQQIEEMVNDEIKKIPTYGNREYNDNHWMKQNSPNVLKKRIGGIRLYRMLVDTFNIANPKTIKEKIPEVVWTGSKEFVKGYISGIIYADGGVLIAGHAKKTTVSVRINQSNEKILNDIQILLLNLGIVSKVYSRRDAGMYFLPNGKGGNDEYFCKENFELIINRPNSIKLMNKNILFGRKQQLLIDVLKIRGLDCNKKEKFKTTIKNISYDSTQDVFCLKQEKTNTVIANGLVVGQCVEINLYGYDEFGNSGWEFCNLTTINMKKCKNEQDFYDACKASSILGTIQASYTNFEYLGEVTERIVRKEALLGCSITGFMDNPEISLNPKIQKTGAEIIIKENERISKLIDINAAARTTCVKPEGSASCLLGSSSGIHPHHAKRYIRRVQANKNEFPLQYFKLHNPKAVEDSVWSTNKTDEVISFLCEVPEGSKVKNQVGAIDLLKNVMTTQQNWIEYGTTKRSVQPWLRHNVSNTITVKNSEWDDVEKFIYNNRKWFAGISLLPESGDLDYPQAPFSTVLNEKEIIQEFGEGALFASGLIVDGQHAFDNNLWAACDNALGIGETLIVSNLKDEPIMPNKNGYTDKIYAKKLKEYTEELTKFYNDKEKFDKISIKIDWCRRFKQFADRYVEGNLRKCTHLLKYVSLWKQWLDLKREYIDVDWSLALEEDYGIDVTTLAGAACQGGACESGDLGASIKASKEK